MSETVHDLGALRALREVGRQGSIAAAAAVLGVSQQALSARMRSLERAMRINLLARTPTGSRLTEQGRLIVGWAEDVLDAADRLEAGLRSIRSGVSHRLAIAASQTIAEHLVPHWLVELRSIERSAAGQSHLIPGEDRAGVEMRVPTVSSAEQSSAEQNGPRQGTTGQGRAGQDSTGQDSGEQGGGYPPTVVELTVANSTAVVELVRDGKAGLGFIETPHLPADLVAAHLRDDEMLVVTAPGHPWARRRRPLPLAEIAATPLVMREAGSGTRDTLTDHLAAQIPPLHARIAMELGTSAAVRSAIAMGVGPGVLSRLAVRDDLVLGRLVAVEVAGPPLTRQLTAVWRPDHDPLPPEGARLLAVARGLRG
jgi:DNA-binding transcriptional LysR family regulator